MKRLLPGIVQEVFASGQKLRQLGFSRMDAVRTVSSRHGRVLLAAGPVAAIPTCQLVNIRTVVDVGANEGVFSEAAIRFLRPERLIAIEPAPAPLAALRRRLARYPEVTVVGVALDDTDGDRELHNFERSELNSLLAPTQSIREIYDVAELGTTTVRAVRLDDLLQEHDMEDVDLLKIDVQGGEFGVLRGAPETLARTRCLMIELLFVPHYHGEASFSELHDLLGKSGFFLYSLANMSTDSMGRLLWADAVYRSTNE